MAAKYTHKQFQAQYPDDAACLQAILERRYGNIDCCPNCGVVGKLTRIEGRRAFACKEGCHVYPCAGTIFEHSPTPLTDWFYAMYLMTATRNGVSAKELQRQLGVTYKCAWRIGHQLRKLMAARDKANNPDPLKGHVEIDETYVGGKRPGKRGRGAGGKTIVVGMAERGGDIKTQIVDYVNKPTLHGVITANVQKGSKISTDQIWGYRGLSKIGYKHKTVNHSKDEWARGDVYTNTVEGFWSHLKRGIKSTHTGVSKQHLQKYVDEFAFRFNNRHAPADMFARMLAQVSNPTSS